MPVMFLGKLAMGKGLWIGAGALVAVFVGLSLALWHQSGKAAAHYEAATIASEALAVQIATTQHLREQIDVQNAAIRALQADAERRDAQARDRAARALAESRERRAQSQALDAGPQEMNRWFASQW